MSIQTHRATTFQLIPYMMEILFKDFNSKCKNGTDQILQNSKDDRIMQ